MSMAFAPGLPNVMAPVNMPSYGPDIGWSAVTGGYNSGAGLAPLSDPYAGQGYGIYNDASMYRGGDFWGGGSDPYAGTIYAGGGGGNPGPLYSGGGIGSDAGATGGHYENSYSYDGGTSTVWVPDGPWGMNDMGIPPNYGTPEPQQSAPSGGGGNNWWEGAGWNPYFNSPGAQQSPPQQAAPSYGDYSSARDFMGGGGGGGSYTYDINGSPTWVPDYGSGRDFMGGGDYGGRDQLAQAMLPGDIGSFPGRNFPSPGYTPNSGYFPPQQPLPGTNPNTGFPYNQAFPPGSGGQMNDFPSYQWPPGLAGENVFVGSPGMENIWQVPQGGG